MSIWTGWTGFFADVFGVLFVYAVCSMLFYGFWKDLKKNKLYIIMILIVVYGPVRVTYDTIMKAIFLHQIRHIQEKDVKAIYVNNIPIYNVKKTVEILKHSIWYYDKNISSYIDYSLLMEVVLKNEYFRYKLEYSCAENEYVLIKSGQTLVLPIGLRKFLTSYGFPDPDQWCIK